MLCSGVVMAQPFTGLYTDGEAMLFVVETPNNVWAANGQGARLMRPAALKLTAPTGKAWQLQFSERTYSQRHDPFLGRILARLQGKLALEGIGDDGKPSPGATFTIEDGIYFRNELPSATRGPKCIAGYLMHDPTWNRERPLEPSAKQPPTGKIGVRLFDVVAVSDCPTRLAKAGVNAPAEMLGGKIYARDDGEVLAIEIVSYMYVALYARAGLPLAVLTEVRGAAAEDAAHQAE
jgi:hypothetical protein